MNRLTRIKFAYKDKYSLTYSYYQCVCGTIKIIRDNMVKSGNTKSCGCLWREMMNQTGENAIAFKHGHKINRKVTPEYHSWYNMKSRCYNPNYRNYKYWGGKGIKVCKRWFKFENFLKDMGMRPPNTSLDRIDGTKNYCKSNCRWATRLQQNQNRPHKYDLKGQE